MPELYVGEACGRAEASPGLGREANVALGKGARRCLEERECSFMFYFYLVAPKYNYDECV